MKLDNLLENKKTKLWFGLSLVVPLYFGLISIYYAFSQDYIVQDDARQHIVWLQRFVDSQLFPNDFIADYFQNVAPAGYKFFYWIMANIGIEPIILAKILPLFLGLITTAYMFGVSRQIFTIPVGAFLITLIFNHIVWLNDDVISATPRAFLYPLFAAFLYYLLKRKLIGCLVTIALMGLFYPQILLLEIAVLTVRLFRWQFIIPKLSSEKEYYIFWLSGLIVALMVMLPFALNISEFGKAITATEMKTMPEYGWQGRNEYFGVNPLSFIFDGSSGLRIPVLPSVISFGLGLPWLLKYPLPLTRFITKEIKILWEIILASLGLFFLAHLFLLKLHFPSRYTYHSFRFVMAIASGIVLLVIWEHRSVFLSKIEKIENKKTKLKRLFIIRFLEVFTIISLIGPFIPVVFLKLYQGWQVGKEAEIYLFLSKQPQDILVASLAQETNNLPAFSQRSILVGREFALPHHPNYYEEIKQRAIDTVRAQYSAELSETKRIIHKYGIDFFLVERDSFDPEYLLGQNWLIHSSFKDVVFEAIAQLKQGKKPALAKLVNICGALSTENLILLDTACVKDFTDFH